MPCWHTFHKHKQTQVHTEIETKRRAFLSSIPRFVCEWSVSKYSPHVGIFLCMCVFLLLNVVDDVVVVIVDMSSIGKSVSCSDGFRIEFSC